MKVAIADFSVKYFSALEIYIGERNEEALRDAYEIGRRALEDGLGVLDMAMIHHRALLAIAGRSSMRATGPWMQLAAEFFAESLSSFEMSLRGYREANTHLTVLNATLQRAHAATEAANRELEAFSYSVAHDLRAPLRSIDGFSQAIIEDYADKLDAQGVQYLNYVRESAQQMAEMIDGLLTLSRVTRSDLNWKRVDLASLARATFAQLQRGDPERSVELVMPQGEAFAEGDPRLLKQLLENLIGNAWKFTSRTSGARIEFGVMSGEPSPTFFVRDNGAGFDMAYASKLFNVFQRLHSASEYEGTGIGLATAQRIAARHGGRIWAKSSINHGATFFFTLAGEVSA